VGVVTLTDTHPHPHTLTPAIVFNPVLIVDEESTIIGENIKNSDIIGDNKVYSEKIFNN
jgi:hypothetical protein